MSGPPGPQATIPLAQAFDIAARSNIRRPPRAQPQPTDPGADPNAAGDRLLELVEAEQAQAAEALLLGAVDRGWGWEQIGPWFYRLCAAHFLSFGHPFIYTAKMQGFLGRTDPSTLRYSPSLTETCSRKVVPTGCARVETGNKTISSSNRR